MPSISAAASRQPARPDYRDNVPTIYRLTESRPIVTVRRGKVCGVKGPYE
jgi:hypothetical protein